MKTSRFNSKSANIDGTKIHYTIGGSGPVVILLHGFAETSRMWAPILPTLAAKFTVVAPDLPGIGDSSIPRGEIGMKRAAIQMHDLVRSLGIEKARIVGHDIGLMVAYAYAQAFRDEASHLVVMDAPLPGTAVFDRLRVDPRVWQFAFHSARDVPEMLIAGRERAYLQAFFNARIYDPSAISDQELDVYASAYAAPGAMRAGLELYRAFDRDIADNRAALAAHGKLTLPVLAVGGQASTTGPLMAEMMREVAENVTELRIPHAAHWIAEENPEAFLAGLEAFLERP